MNGHAHQNGLFQNSHANPLQPILEVEHQLPVHHNVVYQNEFHHNVIIHQHLPSEDEEDEDENQMRKNKASLRFKWKNMTSSGFKWKNKASSGSSEGTRPSFNSCRKRTSPSNPSARTLPLRIKAFRIGSNGDGTRAPNSRAPNKPSSSSHSVRN